MNARAILLCLACGLVAAAPAAARADVLPRYAETVWMNADGSAHLDIQIDLPAGTTSPVRLPLGAGEVGGLTVSGVDGASPTLVSDAGRRYVSISFPTPPAAPATLRVSGDVQQFFAGMKSAPRAFGNRTMTYRFLNSTMMVFAKVDNQIVLPAGYVVQSIEDSEPSADESSTGPPYAIVVRDGRHAVRIAVDNVGLGGAASVTLRFKQRTIAPFVPAALLAMGAAYLIGFRSLTRKLDAPR